MRMLDLFLEFSYLASDAVSSALSENLLFSINSFILYPERGFLSNIHGRICLATNMDNKNL